MWGCVWGRWGSCDGPIQHEQIQHEQLKNEHGDTHVMRKRSVINLRQSSKCAANNAPYGERLKIDNARYEHLLPARKRI